MNGEVVQPKLEGGWVRRHFQQAFRLVVSNWNGDEV